MTSSNDNITSEFDFLKVIRTILPEFTIAVDISDVWNSFSLSDMLRVEQSLMDAHAAIAAEAEDSGGHCGWVHLPSQISKGDLNRILGAADQIRRNSKVLVVVGNADCSAGAAAAIQMICGMLPGADVPCRVLFSDGTLSTRALNELLGQLDSLDFSLLLAGKTGDAIEETIVSRALRMKLSRKYGSEAARQRLYIVTDPERGTLHDLAVSENCTTFELPKTVPERFSLFTAGGLIPMAVAGIDIRNLLLGAWSAEEKLDLRELDNPAWNYVAARNTLCAAGRKAELLSFTEPCFGSTAIWWQQLFSGIIGTDGQGMFPIFARYPRDFSSTAQFLCRREVPVLETMVRFEPDLKKLVVDPDLKDAGGLNALRGVSIGRIESAAFTEITSRHSDAGVPLIQISCRQPNAATLGELFYFFQISAALSARAMGSSALEPDYSADFSGTLVRQLTKK